MTFFITEIPSLCFRNFVKISGYILLHHPKPGQTFSKVLSIMKRYKDEGQ